MYKLLRAAWHTPYRAYTGFSKVMGGGGEMTRSEESGCPGFHLNSSSHIYTIFFFLTIFRNYQIESNTKLF